MQWIPFVGLLKGIAQGLENQHEQSNDHQQTDEKDDADGAGQKLQHIYDSLYVIHPALPGNGRSILTIGAKARFNKQATRRVPFSSKHRAS